MMLQISRAVTFHNGATICHIPSFVSFGNNYQNCTHMTCFLVAGFRLSLTIIQFMTPVTDTAAVAFIDVLYREHHGWLYAWLKKKMSCPHQAADLSQDTFVRLLSLPVLPCLREPRAYLLVTANRLMLNFYRKRRVETEVLASISTLLGDQSNGDVAHVCAVRQLLEQVLLMLIEELDAHSRQAFLLARVDGMRYAEIAKMMGISESRVKQHLIKSLAYCHSRLYQIKVLADA